MEFPSKRLLETEKEGALWLQSHAPEYVVENILEVLAYKNYLIEYLQNYITLVDKANEIIKLQQEVIEDLKKKRD